MKKKIFLILLAFALSFSLIGVVNAVGTYPTVDPNMVLYYHFNNQSAYGENRTNAYDFSGNGNNGTVIGGAIHNNTGGYLGDGSFKLDKLNDYITRTIVSSSHINSSVTLNVWFYSSNSTATQVIGGYSASSSRLALGLIIQSGNTLRGHCNDNLNNLAFPTGGTILKNTWYMGTVTYSPSSCKVYLNGNLVGSNPTATGYLPIQNSRFTIGRWGSYSQNYLNGSVDDVIIYNRTLSSQDIAEIYTKYSLNNECTKDNLTLGCVIDNDFTFSGSNINLNGSAPNTTGITDDNHSAIFINASNIIIDLNGSKIYGNWTNTILGTGKGSRTLFYMRGSWLSNITFKNGEISNYKNGITHDNLVGSGFYHLLNMTFNNNNYAIRGYRSGNTVYNSTFNNSYDDAVRFEGSSSSNNIIEYNTFIGGADCISLSSTASNSGNNTIRFNSFLNGFNKYGIILSASNNNLIDSNIFNGRSDGIGLPGNSHNNTIKNNIFINSTENGTTWKTCPTCHGIHQYNEIGSEDNLVIYNNSFYMMTSAIILTNVTNTNISNNYLNYSQGYQIRISNAGNLTFNNNIIKNHGKVQLGGGAEFQPSPYKINYFVNNNLFDNFTPNLEFIGLGTNTFIRNTSNGDYLLLNRSSGSATDNITLQGLTSALLTNGTSLCNGSSSNLALNTGNINITLQPNKACWVLDDFSSEQDFGLLSFLIGVEEATNLYSELNFTIPIMVWLRLNEANGTNFFDSSGNGNTGTCTGTSCPTWQTDGITRTLVSGVDYTIGLTTGILTLSSDYLYSWVDSSWNYYQIGRVTDANNILLYTSTGINGFFSSISPVYGILAILVILLVLIVLVRIVNPQTKQNLSSI